MAGNAILAGEKLVHKKASAPLGPKKDGQHTQ